MALGETRRLVEDRRGRFMVRPAGRAVEHAIKEQREGGGSIHLRPAVSDAALWLRALLGTR
jgi:hypothetical protein